MSKKNLNVLRNFFENSYQFLEIYNHFKKKIKSLKSKKFLVAVSGGPDSLALVALSQAYSFETKTAFNYLLVDHNLRTSSAKEAKTVKKILKKHDIELNIARNKLKINSNIQKNARDIRYKILSQYCEKKKIKFVITAHNLDDQVETFFIRLARGSGLTGLSSMSTLNRFNKNTSVFRPLLDIEKKSLVYISKKIFGKYIKDPSNKNTKYLRTKVRNLKKPLEDSGIEYSQIIKSIKNLASSKATLDNFINKILEENVNLSKKEVTINFAKFNEFNDEIKIRLINHSIKILKDNYYNPRAKKVTKLIKNLEKKNFKRSTLGGCIISKKNRILTFRSEKNVKNS